MYAICCVIEHRNGRNMYCKLQCQMIALVHLMHTIRDNLPSKAVMF